MSALFVGHAASTVVLGLSPWIIPLIAVAAKLTYDQARDTFRSESSQNRSSREGNAGREGGARHQEVPQDYIKARMAGK
jgi:hypothetical protein